MHKPAVLFFSGLILLAQTPHTLPYANEWLHSSMPSQEQQKVAPQEQPSEFSPAPFSAFTGKVTKNKVRLRLQPNLDTPVVKELTQGDMLIIIGETEDFFAVQPPKGIKSYVFRTYILDNVVEASRVNVRLEPDLDAPVIAQLHAGDQIQGNVSTLNNKWLEIAPPSTARFYIAKDYIEKIGDATVMATLEKRRDEINILLNSAYVASQTEMQKSFPEINLDQVYANFNKIISLQKEFPEQGCRAKELLSSVQDSYLQKKIAYLEAKSKIVQDDWQTKHSQLNEQMKNQQQKVCHLEQQLKKSKDTPLYSPQEKPTNNSLSNKMAAWLPAEQALYEDWAKANENKSQEDYYHELSLSAIALKGIIEPYTRVIKNKPGDYLLVNQSNHLPVAYLYSTRVNLQDKMSHEVTIYAIPRNNYGFAFPAYFVLSVE